MISPLFPLIKGGWGDYRVVVIHERKPMLTNILIILVGEEIGY